MDSAVVEFCPKYDWILMFALLVTMAVFQKKKKKVTIEFSSLDTALLARTTKQTNLVVSTVFFPERVAAEQRAKSLKSDLNNFKTTIINLYLFFLTIFQSLWCKPIIVGVGLLYHF